LLILGPRERPYGIERLEPHDGLELDLVVDASAKQFDAMVPGDVAASDAAEDFFAEKMLIRISVCGIRPSVPYATNHLGSSSVAM
jgi:hypothetical protein